MIIFIFISMKILLLLLLLCCAVVLRAQQATTPNIILFLVDDMGWNDSSVPFGEQPSPLNKRYHTPYMERLAREGMKFSQAYATPVCTPSRVSLMTGMNAAHHRVTNWTHVVKGQSSDVPDSIFAPARWCTSGMSPEPGIPNTVYATPLPALLRDAGYFTIHAGKAHWGAIGTPGANPLNMGFLVNIAGHAAGHPQSYLGEENYGNLPGKATYQAVPGMEEYYGSSVFLTEALTRAAIRSLETPVRRRQPFFLYMGHYAVHTPIQADARYFKQYLAEGLDTVEARYASLIAGMDKSLGDVMDYLQQQQIADNTIILFMSDNGGLSLAPPRGGSAHTQNLPLKAGKGSVYEGGIREPMLVKWPGVTKAGSSCSQYVIIEDFFPSILEMAGVKNYRAVQTADGISFVPLLQGGTGDSTRTLIWHYPNKWIPQGGPGINYASAIRRGNWKLIYRMDTGRLELYHLKKDQGEMHNVAAQYPDLVKSLAAALAGRLREWDAPMPILRNTGKQVPLPDEVISF